ncbi:hypothetical protein D9619_011476 [Psilocybe cf. subviscida]|uniref:Uncharacterized protein n=1 Tax=Psilocybe cf. subviscida TaxID=2480587 RepID=A0A8H5BSU3_9AGAR|nr:hypothetical protein D9619_011476 [Psilocybe cf. subviscida]
MVVALANSPFLGVSMSSTDDINKKLSYIQLVHAPSCPRLPVIFCASPPAAGSSMLCSLGLSQQRIFLSRAWREQPEPYKDDERNFYEGHEGDRWEDKANASAGNGCLDEGQHVEEY